MNSSESPKKERYWSKLKRSITLGAKAIIPVAIGWAVGSIFPQAGIALYKFIKDKLNETALDTKIVDSLLKKICNETIGEKSIEYLQKKLKQLLGESTNLNEKQLTMVIGTILHPLNESLNTALDYIKSYPNQIQYILNEWRAENIQLLHQYQVEIENSTKTIIDTINEDKSQIMEGITEIKRKISQFENIIIDNFATGVKQIFASDSISSLDFKILSQAQLSMAYYSSKFDIEYDPERFVIRKEADDAFIDFLKDYLSPFPSDKNLFLILAGAGMGKTWMSANWAHKLSTECFELVEGKKFVPFYVTIRYGLDVQLSGYLGAKNKTIALNNLRKARDTSELTPILFFDGLDEINAGDARGILTFIIDVLKEKIPVVLTCRDSDWSREDKIIEMHSSLNENCYVHEGGSSYNIKTVTCPPSLNIGTFTDEQMSQAIRIYHVPIDYNIHSQLYNMAKHPILLRLFSDYYKKNRNLPNPNDVRDFSKIFLGEKDDSPKTNILGRLGIIGKKRDYLVQLSEEFLKKGTKLKISDIAELVKETENFKAIRNAGLINEEWGVASTVFTLNDLYRPHLEHMINIARNEFQLIERTQIQNNIQFNSKNKDQQRIISQISDNKKTHSRWQEKDGKIYTISSIPKKDKLFKDVYDIIKKQNKGVNSIIKLEKLYNVKWRFKPFSWSYLNEFKPNARWFFCGVKEGKIQHILDEGFSTQPTDKYHLLGNGIYLSYHIAKALKDTDNNYIISCLVYAPRVLLKHPEESISLKEIQSAQNELDAIELRSNVYLSNKKLRFHQICVFDSKRVVPRFILQLI